MTTNSLTETRNDDYNVTSQAIANYMGTFGSHNLTVMATGFENYYMKSESLGAARDKYELTGYPYLNIGSEDFQTNSGTGSEYTSNSVFTVLFIRMPIVTCSRLTCVTMVVHVLPKVIVGVLSLHFQLVG